MIRAITVDTNHFRGNHPAECSFDAAELSGGSTVRRERDVRHKFAELLPRSPLVGHAENELMVRSEGRFTHVRLNIYPDGGVARLRVWGEARPDWRRIAARGRLIDLVAVQHGGLPVATSDQFFSGPLNLIIPGRARSMADGWETRRRRGPGHDWVVLRLGARGVIERIELDTTHFKGNFPESAGLEGCDAPDLTGAAPPPSAADWRELVPRAKLRADAPQRFRIANAAHLPPVTHVRLNIYPDGGVARLRLWGRPIDRT